MKKVLVASAVSLANFGLPAVALADSITNTGPDSYNIIQNNTQGSFTIKCKNDTDVVVLNNQTTNSGQATVTGNTTGGNAQSGDVVNQNDVKLDVDVACAPVTQSSQNTTPTPTNQGGGTVLGNNTTTAPSPKVAALPNTGSSPISAAIITSLAMIASGTAIAFGRVPEFLRKALSR